MSATTARTSSAPNPAQSAPAPAAQVKALFVITGPADPGLLPRIIEPVAKLGQIPARVYATTESGDGSEMTVDLRFSNIPARTARQIETALRAVVAIGQIFAVIEPLR